MEEKKEVKTAIAELIEFITDTDGTPLQHCNDIYDKAIQLQNKYAAQLQQPAPQKEQGDILLCDGERTYVKHTIALLNSMVKCGDNHSEQSSERVQHSFKILSKPEIIQPQQPAPDEKGVNEVEQRLNQMILSRSGVSIDGHVCNKLLSAISDVKNAYKRRITELQQSLAQEKEYEIDFAGIVKARVIVYADEIEVADAMDGYGNKIDTIEIDVHDVQPEKQKGEKG